MARLLIMGCTERKRHDAKPLAAIDRYDGPTFRVLRKYMRDNPRHDITVAILSAELGLIESTRQIDDYDRKMDRKRCAELRESCSLEFRALLAEQRWEGVGVCLSKVYLPAVLKETNGLPILRLIQGGQGPRLRALKDWLESSS